MDPRLERKRMRVLLVALGLAVTPFVAGVSQGRGHDAAHCARRADQHPNKDINKCPAPAPAPVPDPTPAPACAVSPVPASSETGRITGQLWNEADWSLLVGWCVHLSGPVSATMQTNGQGMYDFGGLPGGTYTVCEDMQGGLVPDLVYNQACQTVTVPAGNWQAFNDFVNKPQ